MKIGIIAGVHGNEQAAILAAIKVRSKLENITLNKVEVNFLVPANINGVMQNSRDWVDVSSYNLNRYTDIDDYGLKVSQSFDKCRKNIDEFIEENDVIIDIHNSESCSNFLLFDNLQDYSAEIKHCLNSNTQFVIWNSSSKTIKWKAKEQNKLAMTYEFYPMKLFQYERTFEIAVVDILGLILSFENHKSVMNKYDSEIIDQAKKLAKVNEVYSQYDGFFEPLHHLSEVVEPENILKLYPHFLNFNDPILVGIEEVNSPVYIAYYNTRNWVEAGELLFAYTNNPLQLRKDDGRK